MRGLLAACKLAVTQEAPVAHACEHAGSHMSCLTCKRWAGKLESGMAGQSPLTQALPKPNLQWLPEANNPCAAFLDAF